MVTGILVIVLVLLVLLAMHLWQRMWKFKSEMEKLRKDWAVSGGSVLFREIVLLEEEQFAATLGFSMSTVLVFATVAAILLSW